MGNLGGLVLSLKKYQQIRITGPDGLDVVMRLVSGGRSPRVLFNAPRDYEITRETIDDDDISIRDGRVAETTLT